MFLKKLTFLLTRKYKHLWRLQLGADSAARVKPLKLTFDEQRFPKNVHPRRYSPPQQEFLDKQIAEMVRVGILNPSSVGSTLECANTLECAYTEASVRGVRGQRKKCIQV